MTSFGFKRITPENWLEPDHLMAAFVSGEDEKSIPSHDWVELIHQPELTPTVPEDVAKLYETARGAMVYGWFFYPLYTLAEQQLFRVAEAAITHRCGEIVGGSHARKSFEAKIVFLEEAGIIGDDDIRAWHSIRRLRNSSSHPRAQSIQTPPETISMLHIIAERINALWH